MAASARGDRYLNDWEFFSQLRATIRAARWPLAPNELVFAKLGVVVIADLSDEYLGKNRLPCALIRIQDSQSDPEHNEEPDLFAQTFDVTIACAIPNDASGEAAFLGGAGRSVGSSAGKGILEIAEQLIAAIKALGASNGVRIQERMKGAAAGTPVADIGYLAWRTYRFEADLSGTRNYPNGSRFVATGGSGQIAATWMLPFARFDYRRMVLRYQAGASAPATISSGTGAVLGGSPDGVTATSKTITGLSAGTYSLALFAVYDDLVTGTDAQVSVALTRLSVVVT